MLARTIPLLASALLVQACWHSSEVEPEVCSSLFASDLPPGAPVVHVLAAAEAGGDGSIEHPFRTVTEGVSAARPGDTVAVGDGTYDELVTLPSSITLVGACPGGTVLTSSIPAASPTDAVVTIGGVDVEVRTVTITSTTRSAVVAAGEGRRARLSDVVLSGWRHAAYAADRAWLSMESFRAHDSLCGLALSGGGELDLADGYVERNEIGACLSCGDTELDWLTADVRFVGNVTNLDALDVTLDGLEACP
jgi:hypothetical protein